ncbi:MAG: metallophosphoesterase [Ruminococcus sp.]|nr:metallophosphoesterase [Ruminococcus sp.]
MYCNRNLKVNTYNLSFDNLPKEFENFRIVQVSDLHNCTFGINNAKLLTLIKNSKPDIIAITGDMIDSRKTNIKIAASFAQEAVKIAPCYYVSGNHEARMPKEYQSLLNELEKSGVTILENKAVKIKRGAQSITLLGAKDPFFIRSKTQELNCDILDKSLSEILKDSENDFTVLLSHRPEHLSVYAKHSIDLCLTGHAHGGQIRLPFIGGLFAPNQGFLPKFDAGLFKEQNTTMVISRGVGSSQFPLRFLNPPEIPVAVLKHN